jgi:hypothetical protein
METQLQSALHKVCTASNSTAQLISNIKAVARALEDPATTIDINILRDHFAYILYSTSLHNHPSFTFRLYLSYCFALSFSRFAPELPIGSKPELRRIFALFSTVFSSNSSDSADQNKLLSISEILVATDAHLLLIEDSELAREIAESLLEAKSTNSSAEFLVRLINEIIAIDSLVALVAKFSGNSILEKIVPKLTPTKKTQIIAKLPKVIPQKEFLSKFPRLAMLFQIPLDFLLESLQPEIIVENDGNRLKAIQLVSEIIQNSLHKISASSAPLKFVLDRHRDRSEPIRFTIVKLSLSLFHANPEMRRSIINIIDERLKDTSERIRLLSLQSQESHNFAYKQCICDASLQLREAALKILQSQILHGREDLTEVIKCYKRGEKMSVFCTFQNLFQELGFVALYNLSPSKREFMNIFCDLHNFKLNLESIITSFTPIDRNWFPVDHWQRYLPSVQVWYNIRDLKKVERLTSPEFAHQIGAITNEIAINPSEIIETDDKFLIRKTANLFPQLFLSSLSYVLEFPTNQNLFVIKPLLPLIEDKTAILKNLAEIGTKAALIQIASIAPPIHVAYPILTVEGFHFDLSEFGDSFVLHFFAKLSNPSLIPSLVWQMEITSVRQLKRIIKLARISSNDRLLRILIKKFDEFPIECFTSFLSCGLSVSTEIMKKVADFVRFNENSSVRHMILEKLHEALKKPSTDVRFLGIFGLVVDDCDSEILEFAEKSIEYHVRLRKAVGTSVLAEYCLPTFFLLNDDKENAEKFVDFFDEKIVMAVCTAFVANTGESLAQAVPKKALKRSKRTKCPIITVPEIFLKI